MQDIRFFGSVDSWLRLVEVGLRGVGIRSPQRETGKEACGQSGLIVATRHGQVAIDHSLSLVVDATTSSQARQT